ncbi:MAG: alpha/beta hydrolase [Verrucomicrobia bacterium]|nr:alpha/beta hydrolase [Verrucomicrobiota bacterium]
MTLRRFVRLVLLSLLAVVLLIGISVGSVWWYFHPAVTRTDGIVYTERHGHKLSFDIVRPAHPNGLGILLMVSGGWHSSTNDFRPFMAAPLIRRGYTVFAVSHLSQPKATVMEIVEDVNRATRFIRFHAREYGIDPDRIGVTGGSAGGHLSLMLATRGGSGPSDAADPVDRASSAVQAAAIFYPVTDLLNLGPSTENLGDGGPPKSFLKAFGPQGTNLAVWKVIGREVSPIYYITTNLPPTLIIHGGADTLVPLEQSEHFQTQARAIGRNVELIIRPGKQHGWLTMFWDFRLCADWFDKYLRK